jgi:MscS family membrane protein
MPLIAGESWLLRKAAALQQWAHLEWWQAAGLFALVLVAAVLSFLLGRAALRLAGWLTSILGFQLDSSAPELIAPARVLTALVVVRANLPLLELPAQPYLLVIYILSAIAILAIGAILIALTDFGFQRLSTALASQQRSTVRSAIPVARRALKAAIGVGALLAILGAFGYDTGTLLAGLGIGGLAVAFAAQKTLENLFGGFTLVIDAPVTVGDTCRIGDRVATVEDIGLRSTRLRTPERTVITVPNGVFSSGQIENLSSRERLLFKHELRIARSATTAQIRVLLNSVRQMLIEHPLVDPDPARIRLSGFGDYSINLEIFAYVQTTDFEQFLETQQELLLQILELVERAGTELAIPAQCTVRERIVVRTAAS